jgi:hypothetical protein
MSYRILTQNYDSILTQDGLYYLSYFRELPPLSSGTEQVITYILNSDISIGTPIIRTFVPPHPVWTDNQNREVIQLNTVTIGGNGLNS